MLQSTVRCFSEWVHRVGARYRFCWIDGILGLAKQILVILKAEAANFADIDKEPLFGNVEQMDGLMLR